MKRGEVFTAWNTEKLGKYQAHNHVKLYKDYRDCLMVLTSKGFVIVNVHMPQPHEQKDRKTIFIRHLNKQLANWEWSHIIMCGDFNDNSNISLLPICLKKEGSRLKLNPAKVDMRTCCYDSNYGMDKNKKYKLRGDYVLSNLKSRTGLLTFDSEGYTRKKINWRNIHENPRSDHEPVYSEIVLPQK